MVIGPDYEALKGTEAMQAQLYNTKNSSLYIIFVNKNILSTLAFNSLTMDKDDSESTYNTFG